MVSITIDNKAVNVPEGSTILDAAAVAQVKIPTLCHMQGIHEIGACRVCVVEAEGEERLLAACNTVVENGMVLRTNTERVRVARKTNLELMLSEHDSQCTTCVRSGNCSLQSMTADFNILNMPFEKKLPKNRWDRSLPLIRNESKCISCLRCVSVCDKVQSLGVWEFNGSGGHAKVGVSGGKPFVEANCSLCGQCITHCPVGALQERDDTEKVFSALADPDKIVVIQVAPAVRAAWGDGIGLPPELATEKRMAAALRAMGANYVFDTNFAADLTIMEEGSEFIERFTHPSEHPMPLLTSCCPGWVRFVKMEYPHLVENLSTAKSPQQMFGAVAKSYFAEKINVAPEKIYSVSVMPCTAKKYECDVEAVNDAGAGKDVDVVLTTREFDRMLRTLQMNVANLPEEEFDSPLGEGTGAAVIFGATGGVMEAAVRSAYFLLTGENPKPDFNDLRGLEGWRESTLDIKGTKVRLAVASGLGNARRLLDAVTRGDVTYDFIEVMACPGGCAGGGGQPICDGMELAGERGAQLYALDKANVLRFSHENPSVQALYKEYMEKPLSHKSHHLLHTHQKDWKL